MAQSCLALSGHTKTIFPGLADFQRQVIYRSQDEELGIEQGCVFCGERNESRDHLYFACPYTFTVWMNVAESLLAENITPDWVDTITSLLETSRSGMDTILLRLVFLISIYVLWKERNSRRHGGDCVSVDMTNRVICKMVKNKSLL